MRMSTEHHVLAVVVGADTCGLGLVRSLSRGGVSAIIVDRDKQRPGMHSRYARPFVAGELSGPGLVETLLVLRSRLDHRPMLFLTSDTQYQTVSEHRDRLAHAFRFPLPEHRCVCELLHKPSFQRIAETLGFPVPRSVAMSEESHLARLAGIQFPAVIKPGTKDAFFKHLAPRAMRVEGRDEAEAICRAILPVVPDLIVQEWVDGEESDIYFCLQYRGQDFTTVSTFTGRKIRCWPPQTGSTASCIAAPEAAHILEPLTTAFFDRTEFVGLCSMEYKRDRRTGAFLMIEPTVGRADFQEEIATLNGVNIPLAAFRHELGLPLTPPEPPCRPVVWQDPPCYWRSVIAGRSFRDTAPPRVPVVNSCWRTDDPMPVLFFWFEWLQKAWRPSRWHP
jgi:D-aspartate ligase